MKVLKRKIFLEPSIDRSYDSQTWGTVTADTFYINVFLTQDVYNMGLFTDIEYISGNTYSQGVVDYTILINKLLGLGYTFPFMNGILPPTISGNTEYDFMSIRFIGNDESDYYAYYNQQITGFTGSRIEELKSYDINVPFKVGLDMNTETYINYLGDNVDGVSRVTSVGEPNIYVFDTENNPNIGTINQTTGILYEDYSATTLNTVDNVQQTTLFRFIGEGKNETNTSLSAITKEEYLFGIISQPETESDVFIDRGATTVMEMHLKLSEVKNIGELSRYGNGFYNIRRT